MEKKNKIAKRIIAGLITEEKRKKISQFLKDRSRTGIIRQVSKEDESHLDAIIHNCLKHVRPVTAPLMLISSIQHAGGVFLNRLFDGHPEIHALPHELMAGSLDSDLWYEFNRHLEQEDVFEKLFEDIAGIHNRFKQAEKDSTPLPFVFLPLIQEQIFRKCLGSADTHEKRDVFEAYITACFGAWLDYQNVSGDKKFTTVCAPGEAMQQKTIDGFFDIYPEGRLIYLIRDPQSWYYSALQAESDGDADVETSIKCWKDGLDSALKSKDRFADHTCLIRVEDLVDKTEKVMRHVATFLGLQYDPILLMPTFNGYPVAADGLVNSAEAFQQHPNEEPQLDEDRAKMIFKMTTDDYQSALKHVIRV